MSQIIGRHVIAVLFVLLPACGSVEDPPVDVDGSVDAVSAVDAVARRCDPNKPFGEPQLETAVNSSGAEGGARLSPDELTMVLSSRPPGANDWNIYRATRSAADATFSSPVELNGVNTTNEDYAVSMSGDSLTVYVMSDRTGSVGGYDIFVGTRASINSDFSSLAPAGGNINSGWHEHYPFINDADLYFARDQGPGNIDLFRATLGPTGFDAPVALTELNTGVVDAFPAISSDGLSMYFASDRTDPAASGALDIYVARRASRSDPFSAATIVTTLNSAATDWPTWVSDDDCVLYLTSARGGVYHVYKAARGL